MRFEETRARYDVRIRYKSGQCALCFAECGTGRYWTHTLGSTALSSHPPLKGVRRKQVFHEPTLCCVVSDAWVLLCRVLTQLFLIFTSRWAGTLEKSQKCFDDTDTYHTVSYYGSREGCYPISVVYYPVISTYNNHTCNDKHSVYKAKFKPVATGRFH